MSDYVQQLLLQLKSTMQELDLWTGCSPSVEAMASVAPFCIDTMELNEWLQWVFIPRMQALLDAGQALPKQCGITPLLEEWGKLQPQDISTLHTVLQQLDEALGGQ